MYSRHKKIAHTILLGLLLHRHSHRLFHITGADPGFLKGGPGADTGFFTSTPPPPLDIVRVTSSALRKFEKHPHSWTFTSTPSPGHCPYDVIHTPKSKGGGQGNHPCHTTHTHPGSATGVHLRSTSKKRGGGPTLGPMFYIAAQKPTS